MKYLNIFLAGVAALGLTACQQDKGDLGKEQQNPQEEMFDAGLVQLALTEQVSSVNLGDLKANNALEEAIPAIEVVDMGNELPEGTELVYTMNFMGNGSTEVVPVVLENGCITGSELANVFQKLFTNYTTTAQKVDIEVAVTAVIPSKSEGTVQMVRLGGLNYYYLTGSSITITPIPAGADFILTAQGVNNLGMGNQLMTKGSAASNNLEYAGFLLIKAPYTLEDTYAENGIKIGYNSDGTLSSSSTTAIPVPADGEGLYYIYIKETSAGVFSYQATKITAAGAIGDFNGWGGDAALTPSDDDLVWTGAVDFGDGGGFKVRFNGGWDISVGNDLTPLNPFPGSGNIAAPKGYYKVYMSLKKLPYYIYLEDMKN